MARNIEIKARVADRDSLIVRVEAIAGPPAAQLSQDDTFFCCAHGRLMRDFSDGLGELIAYERPDTTGPSLSDYERSKTTDPAGLRATLARGLGNRPKVVKTRRLYRVGRTRIHVDRVEDLGDFVELEVVLTGGEPVADGQTEAKALMKEMVIDETDLCATAYVDMLLERKTPDARS